MHFAHLLVRLRSATRSELQVRRNDTYNDQGNAAVPKEFENLIYTGAITNGSVSAEGDNEEQSKFMMLSSSDSVPMVSKWYQDQLKAQSWQVDRIQDMPKLVSINVHKDALELNVMIAEDGPKTTISLSLGKQVDTTEDKEPTENFTPDKATRQRIEECRSDRRSSRGDGH